MKILGIFHNNVPYVFINIVFFIYIYVLRAQ